MHRRSSWIDEGLATGALAASATAGALVATGIRHGTPLRPFNAIAAYLLGRDTGATWGLSAATLVGVALHVAVTIGWALLYVRLTTRRDAARRSRPRAIRHRWGWSVVVALAAFVVTTLAGRIAGAGPATLLALGDRIVVALVLGITLAVGMPFALSLVHRGE